MSFFVADRITKKYSDHLALDDVSLNIPKGTVYGLLGPNGAGKTSLIRIFNRITTPDSGNVLIDGSPLKDADIRKIGYLPEERGLYKKMKVGEQALYLARLKGLSKAEAINRLEFWFNKYEIKPWWYKKIEELSKGMAQKVQFIISLLHDPEILILDEPFSGFDPVNASLLKKEVLNQKAQGKTIILSTHDMASVEELCDNITLIDKAKSILEGKVTDIKQEFKSKKFELIYNSTTNDTHISTFLNQDFEVESVHDSQDNTSKAVIRILKNGQQNELLKQLINEVEILSYQEILPTMNEVFIRAVGNSSLLNNTNE
jgi:ABC-2 type transport system ATP-binding protein